MSTVVDASVVIKWFIDEPLRDRARQWLVGEREPLHAPDLLIAEVGNIAWKKAIRREISERHARQIALALPDLPIALHPSDELIDRALQIALSINHPVYDCLYLACAENLGGIHVTADERLKRAVTGTSLATIYRALVE